MASAGVADRWPSVLHPGAALATVAPEVFALDTRLFKH